MSTIPAANSGQDRTTPMAEAATSPNSLSDILQYISAGWDTLTRAMNRCDSLKDPKTGGVQRRLRRLDHHRLHKWRHVPHQPPRTGFAIRLSLRTVRRCQRRHHKIRMVRQQLHETLADHSGRAQNSHPYSIIRHCSSQ